MELPATFGDKIKKDKNKRLFDAYSTKPSYGEAISRDAWEYPNDKVATSKPRQVKGLTVNGEEHATQVVCTREEYTGHREAEVRRVRVSATTQEVTDELFQVTVNGVVPPECQDLAEFIIKQM